MTDEISTKRQATALEKIQSLHGTPEGEFGPTMFVSHHLEEIDDSYWIEAFGTTSPSSEQILKALVLINNWSYEDDDDLNVFDFGLPGNVSDYLLSVRYDADGSIEEVSMES
jgi:hypothetical protein